MTSDPGARRPARTVARSSVLVVVAALALSACGGPPAASPPAASAAAGAAAPGAGTPAPSRWPASAVTAITTLGIADRDIGTLTADLYKAADTQDLRLMLTASDKLATAIDAATPSIDDLAAFAHTEPTAARYRVAFPLIGEAAKLIHDSLAAGDAAGVEAGFTKLRDGLRAYAALRGTLSDLVAEALTQQRLLVK